MLAGKKILIVDDDMDFCLIYTKVLSSASAEVDFAMSAKEGLEKARADPHPDLVLLDIMMEEADSGFKLAQQLSADCPNMPIVMLSSIASASSQIFDTSTLPTSELLEKPIAPKDLIDTVARLLSP